MSSGFSEGVCLLQVLKLNSVDTPWLEDILDWLLQLTDLHKVKGKVLEQVRKGNVRGS